MRSREERRSAMGGTTHFGPEESVQTHLLAIDKKYNDTQLMASELTR